MAVLLGCIADDFTGGTDLAGMLVEGRHAHGADAGVPRGPLPGDVDAVVVALKSRTAPVESAVADALAALDPLRAAGCRQFFFKYCSTFDSTPRGNIGPVTEALADALAAGSLSRVPHSRRTAAQSTRATCSSATNCCRTPACAITR